MESNESILYFYQQTKFRKPSKRYRKTQDDLPQDLRYAHLNPKLAAYFASKDRELNVKLDDEFDDGLGKNSLLPDINAKVHMIRSSLDHLHPEQDSQRILFEDSKDRAETLLYALAKFLYLFENRKHKLLIPGYLEFYLQCSFRELTSDVIVFPREWQCEENREAAILQKLKTSTVQSDSISGLDGRESLISGTMTARSVGDDSEVSSIKSKDMERRKTLKGPPRIPGGLSDIVETDEPSNRSASRMTESQDTRKTNDTMPSILMNAKREPSERTLVKPKTRLEKYRTLQNTDPRMMSERSHSSFGMRRGGSFRDDTGSIMATSIISEKSLVEKNYYMPMISFQLSSKACEEKGWIIHPTAKDDPERETVLEWATSRLQYAIRQKKEQAAADKELGLDKPIVLRYYGEKISKRQSARLSATPMFKGEKPDIPPTDFPEHDDRKLFMTTLSDGSTTVFYPSGRPAILYTSAGIGKKGFYTIVYEDNEEQRMLGCFTPSGRGACYHDNGVIRFLATRKGGTLSDKDGGVSRRWEWPTHNAKLPSTVVIQMNSVMTLRCQNHSHIQISYSHMKENIKLAVGVAEGAEQPPSKDELGYLVTGIDFQSQSAREFVKPLKAKPSKIKGKVKQKEKKSALTTEVQKIIDLPEQTENDAIADKSLYKLQRKVKTLVEDWLEHYRIAVGIKSPHIKGMRDRPSRRRYGAKSASGEQRVLIEREATSVPAPSVQRRVQSAVPGSVRVDRPISSPSDMVSTLPHDAATVKFDENDEIETVGDNRTIYPSITPGSAGTFKTYRTKSAPNRTATSYDYVSSLTRSLCPVVLRQGMMGDDRAMCKCSRHKIPYITDLEYDEYINNHVPDKQMVIIAVISTLYPDSSEGIDMLHSLYTDKNKNRSRPCHQSKADTYRLFLYDLVTASDCTGYSQPLLLRRHNVVTGMVLMYEGGELLFCDHIFNGYGSAKKDFQKQVIATRQSFSAGRHLPPDFRFSPLHGRKGQRSAWGGEIGGAGVDRHGTPGLTMESSDLVKRTSSSSLSSGGSREMPIDYQMSIQHSQETFNSNHQVAQFWSRYSSRVH